jgi:hypothetical protein
MNKQTMAVCGTYCGTCEWKEKTNCPGCLASQSRPFWGQCKIAACAMEKGYAHCGVCPNMPCETLQSAFSEPEHGDNGKRLINLKDWAQSKEQYLILRSLEPKR